MASPFRTPGRRRLTVAAGLVAGAAGLAVVAGVGPLTSPIAAARTTDGPASTAPTSATVAPSPSPSAAASSTTQPPMTAPPPTAPPGTTAGPTPLETRVVQAGPAGTVTVGVSGTGLTVDAVTPNPGWTPEVEQPAGREVEVDFRRGGERVQVDVELEDGAVRERVRVRDDGGDGRDDRTTAGAGDSGHGADDPPGGDHGRGDRGDHGRGDRGDHGRGDRDDHGRGDRGDHGRGDRDDHGGDRDHDDH